MGRRGGLTEKNTDFIYKWALGEFLYSSCGNENSELNPKAGVEAWVCLAQRLEARTPGGVKGHMCL